MTIAEDTHDKPRRVCDFGFAPCIQPLDAACGEAVSVPPFPRSSPRSGSRPDGAALVAPFGRCRMQPPSLLLLRLSRPAAIRGRFAQIPLSLAAGLPFASASLSSGLHSRRAFLLLQRKKAAGWGCPRCSLRSLPDAAPLVVFSLQQNRAPIFLAASLPRVGCRMGLPSLLPSVAAGCSPPRCCKQHPGSPSLRSASLRSFRAFRLGPSAGPPVLSAPLRSLEIHRLVAFGAMPTAFS